MPSGFQQDVNQLQPNFYRVVIDMTGYPTTDTVTAGGVTPNSADSFEIDQLPTSAVTGRNRARGVLRFKRIVHRLSNLTDCQILDVTLVEPNADTQATSLAFTVKYERDQFIPTTGTDILGGAINSIEGKIKDEVARAILDTIVETARVFDGDMQQENHMLITASAPTTAANVFADVTVVLNSDTTLVG